MMAVVAAAALLGCSDHDAPREPGTDAAAPAGDDASREAGTDAVASSGDDAPREAGTDAVASAPAGGELRLVVDGLPPGIAANVEVIGPNGFRATVPGTATLGALTPGTYTVVPSPVAGTDANLGYDVGTDVLTVDITPDAGATVHVRYEALPTELAPGAVLADQFLAGSLESLQREDDRVTLRFSSMTPQLAALAPGNLLVIPISNGAPEGFLGRVIAVEGTVVTARDAPLEELVVQGVFALGQPMTAASVRAVEPIEDGRSRALRTELVPAASLIAKGAAQRFINFRNFDGVCVNSSNEIAAGIGLGAAVALDSTVCFSGSAQVSIAIKPRAPRVRVNFSFNGSVSSTLRGTALATLGLDVSVPIYRLLLSAKPVGPLVLAPILIVYVNPSGQIATGITTAVTQNVGFGTSLALTGGGQPSQATPSVTGSYSATVEYPHLVNTGTLNLSAGPAIQYSIYGVAGPELGIEGYARFTADLRPRPPTWTVHGGLEFRAGVSMFTGLIRYSGRISVLERLLLRSTDVPPTGADAFRKSTGRSSLGHVAIAADDTIVVAEASGHLAAYTSFGAEKWRVALNAFGNSMVPSIAADGTIYVATYDIFPNEQRLLAVSLENGAILWSQPLGAQGRGAAIAADGTIYVTLYDRLEARSPADGALLWSFPAPDDLSFAGAPAVGPGRDIYVGGFGGLTALRPDGALRWVNRLDGSNARGPALSNDGGTIYVTTDSPNRLVAVEAASGTTLWSTLFANTELATPPVVGLGLDGITTIYAAAIDDRLVAITPGGMLKWTYAALPPNSGDNPSGAPAVASNGVVVLATSDGGVHMLSPAGRLLFKGSALGYPNGAVVIDRRGAAIVPGSCGAFGGACGLTAVFTGGLGPAPSWSKVQGALDNSGRR